MHMTGVQALNGQNYASQPATLVPMQNNMNRPIGNMLANMGNSINPPIQGVSGQTSNLGGPGSALNQPVTSLPPNAKP